jgi:hypothetical protein
MKALQERHYGQILTELLPAGGTQAGARADNFDFIFLFNIIAILIIKNLTRDRLQ